MIEFFDQYYVIIRLLACFIIGFWWCVSGTLLQWSTQNPLSCPVTMGLTALPIIFWMIALVLGLDVDSWQVLISLMLFLFLLHLLFLIYFKSKEVKNTDFFLSPKVIIVGIAINLTLAALFSFLHFYYSAKGLAFPSQLWFGFLKNMDATRFIILILGSIIFALSLKPLIHQLSKLSLGLVVAKNICNLSILEKKLLVFSSLLMCFLVLTGGVFSFWGLVVPHFLRKFSFFRTTLEKEIWFGGVTSGFIMMVLDYLCYQFPVAGSELPVGLLSSILGPILLMTIIIKKTSP